MDSFGSLSSYYNSLSLPQKFHFFGVEAQETFQKLNQKDLAKFLKAVILDQNENANLRKQAIEIHTEYVFIQKLNPRNELTILIDEWSDINDVFLEVRRQKDLFLFYDERGEAAEEIEQIYQASINHTEVEIQAEAYFHLGLIELLKALNSDRNESEHLFNKSYNYFVSSATRVENRSDAIFFQNVVSIILGILRNNSARIPEHMEILAQILWQRSVLSLTGVISPFEVGFYRALFSITKINLSSPSAWLDFRKGFVELHYFYSEIKNAEIKDRLSKSVIQNQLSIYLINNLVEPFFSINLSAEQARIEVRQGEINNSSEEYVFLDYLKALISNKASKKKVTLELNRNELLKAFPGRNPKEIDDELSKISNIDNPSELHAVYTALSKHNLKRFLDSLISACVNLQGNIIFRNSFEDDRNTFVATFLDSQEYLTKDQTRWGKSNRGKQAGEIDIFVREKNGDPFGIIEALNLDSLEKDYISLHLVKIFNYDTIGLSQNFILVYSSAKDFAELWKKYVEYIPQVNYPYKYSEFTEILEYPFTDIKIGKAKHFRNGNDVFLFHIFVNMKNS